MLKLSCAISFVLPFTAKTSSARHEAMSLTLPKFILLTPAKIFFFGLSPLEAVKVWCFEEAQGKVHSTTSFLLRLFSFFFFFFLLCLMTLFLPPPPVTVSMTLQSSLDEKPEIKTTHWRGAPCHGFIRNAQLS